MYLTRDQVREIDRRAIEEFGLPGVVLMENAGRNAAECLLSLGIHGPVAICCGKGNNGGDGFVIARHLHNHGVDVRVLLFAKPDDIGGDAAIHFHVVEKSSVPVACVVDDNALAKLPDTFATCEWIADALFGTGLSGPVRSPFDKVIHAINESCAKVFAVDIPSGLNCDTGEAMGQTVRSDHTVTFVAAKTGFAHQSAKEFVGTLHVADIGVPRQLLETKSQDDQ